MPALANIQVIISVEPMISGQRRPQRSMKIRANIVMKTLITY